MRFAVVLLVLHAAAARAQVEQPEAKTHWVVEWTDEGVPRDGRHIGLTWQRDVGAASTVVIFRRPASGAPSSMSIRVVDEKAQIIPAFMHPDTFRTHYFAAFDASAHPIPAGTQLGVWTVVGSVDGDPAAPFIDRVEPDQMYLYVLVPAKRGAAPDTYDSLEGAAVITPPLAPVEADLIHTRWVQAALAAAGAVVIGAILFAVRRRRAGASTRAEAS